MKVFWWQAGLHIEPETDAEREAVALLVKSARFEKPTAGSGEVLGGSTPLEGEEWKQG